MFDTIDVVPVRRLLETGLVGYVVVCMSSDLLTIRTKAYDLLGRYFQMLEIQQSQGLLAGGGFRERPQIQLLLDSFRGAIERAYMKIPSLLAVFVADAIKILLRPGHAIYAQVNNFLLARPTLDLTDVRSVRARLFECFVRVLCSRISIISLFHLLDSNSQKNIAHSYCQKMTRKSRLE